MSVGPKIVVIGGGTGSFTLLAGLKSYVQHLTALVNMCDNGGSTGQLRDELGVLPPGDVRQCLVALARTPELRELFNFRFEGGTLDGHAFGNIFLAALEKYTGNFARATELAGKILNIHGRVEPISLDPITVCARFADGSTREGEFAISYQPFPSSRPELFFKEPVQLHHDARRALEEANIVVIAPGGLYGSIGPALIVPGVREALLTSRAKVVSICNLVTKPGQTDHFAVSDFAAEIERFIGASRLDYVIYNTDLPDKNLLARYAADGELPVAIDHEKLEKASYHAIGKPLLTAHHGQKTSAGTPRTLIRHDSDAIAREIMKIYFE